MNIFITCAGAITALALIFGFLSFLRYMSYRETLALAEKGLTRPENKSGKGLQSWGIIISVVGLALSLGLYTIGFASGENYPLHLGPWMLGGLIPLFLGLGLILFHYLTEKE